jgi:hypothetical protein
MESNDFKIACMACLRTHVSLDSTRVFADLDNSVQVLNLLAARMARACGSIKVESSLQAAREDGGYYASLTESASRVYSSPLLVIDGIDVSAAARDACAAHLGATGLAHFEVPERTRLFIYDNTVAILEWELRARSDCHTALRAVPPRTLDGITSLISRTLLDGSAGELVAWLEAAIADAWNTKRGSGRDIAHVFRNPRKLDLFFDVDARVAGLRTSHLWTSRTAVLPEFPSLQAAEARDWYCRWAESDGVHIALGPDCDCRIGWGNNAIAGRECAGALADFMAVQRQLQYFYATTIVHNRNVTELLTRGFLASGKAARGIIRKHRLIRTNLQYSETLIFDTENGLQGNNYKVFQAFFTQWRFGKLLEGAQRKVELADRTLSDRLAERRIALQRNLKALLVALSAIEVVGVVIELIDLANNGETAGGEWGLLRLIHAGNPDMIVTTAILLLAVLAAFIVIFGIQAENK